MSANRLGSWSALAVFLIGVIYAITLAIGLALFGLTEPIADPVLAIMEVLTLLSAPALVVVMAAVHGYAPPERKTYSLTALAFMILAAGATSAVHFVELTAFRQMGTAGIAWPSGAYALELLAWDVFLGLSLLFAAPVFENHGLARVVRRGLLVSGFLCLAGVLGPALGDMRLQRVGVLGYAGVLPLVCLMLSRLFRGNQSLTPQKVSHANPPST
jgi:hypothetical protein